MQIYASAEMQVASVYRERNKESPFKRFSSVVHIDSNSPQEVYTYSNLVKHIS